MSSRSVSAIGVTILLSVLLGAAYIRSSTISASPSSAHRDVRADVTKATSGKLPARIEIGSDGYVSLPDDVKLEISDGYITGVFRPEGQKDSYRNILGTRYVVGSLDLTDVTRELWRSISIELTKPDGSIAKINVVRPLWWIEAMAASQGAQIHLSMQEVGVQGDARVLHIGPCEADSREGSPNSALVIGKIEHDNAIALELVFDHDTSHPLGVTANHPLFSSDRHDWVPAGEIRIGEKVGTINGTSTLTGRTEKPGRHKVYNLEVHRTHAYHVSEKGILAHNTGISCFSPKERAIADYLEGFGRKVTRNPLEGVAGAGRQGDALVDGLLHEFKTLDPGATSSTIKNVVNNSIRKGGQARDIVIDARGTGLIKDEALRGINRALGISRGKIDRITVIGDDFFVGLGP